MARIINLTQHQATDEQVAAGVVDLDGAARGQLTRLLTFDRAPDPTEIRARARAIADLAVDAGADAAMIGGAPYLMPALEIALADRGIVPLYAYTRRESVERREPDGAVRKVAVFRHQGWVVGPVYQVVVDAWQAGTQHVLYISWEGARAIERAIREAQG